MVTSDTPEPPTSCRSRLAARVERFISTWSSWRNGVLVVALVVAASAYGFLGQLDNVLAGMHGAQEPSYRMADLAPAFHPLTNQASDVIGVWNAYSTKATAALMTTAGGTIPHRSPRDVVHLYQLIDLVFFIPAYAAVFFLLLVRVERRRAGLPIESVGAEATAAFSRLVRIAMLLVVVLVGVDAFEDVLILVVMGPHTSTLPQVLSMISLAKWVLVALVGVALGVSWLWALHNDVAANRPSLDPPRYLRGQLLLVSAFALGMLAPGPLSVLSSQVQDEMRRWLSNWWMVLPATLATLWFSVLVGVSSRWLLRHSNRPTRRSLGSGSAMLALLSAVVLAVVSQVTPLSSLWIPGAIIGAAVILSWPVSSVPAGGLDAVSALGSWWPRVLAALPLLALGLSVLDAGGIEYAYFGERHLLELMALGVAIEAAGLLVLVGFDVVGGQVAAWLPYFTVISVLAAAYLTVRVWLDVWVAAALLGTIGIVAVFMSVATLIVWVMMWVVEAWEPPGVFVVLGFRRIPVFALLGLWLVVAVLWPGQSSYHDVRTEAAPKGGYPPLILSGAYATWRQAQPVQRSGRRRTVEPLVMVAASGGGIRAAYWTDLVLDCLLYGGPEAPACNPDGTDLERMRRAVFAASGASGGSLGLAEYAAYTMSGAHGQNWVQQRLGSDYVAPTVAWWLFSDVPQAFLGWPRSQDRATTLERAWERSWLPPAKISFTSALWSSGDVATTQADSSHADPLSRGLLQSWYARTSTQPDRRAAIQVPLLLLNGTSTQNGCRFEASALGQVYTPRAGATPCLGPTPADASTGLPSTTFLRSYLCNADPAHGDVRLATAALLSARFPYVSPSGRVGVSKVCSSATAPSPTYVVDGGYYDNSGASTIAQLWASLGQTVADYNRDPANPSCVVPIMIQIDNHYANHVVTPAAGQPLQTLVPPETLSNVQNERETAATLEARLAIAGTPNLPGGVTIPRAPPSRFYDIYPIAHPGSEAPLGWALSALSEQDLRAEVSEAANVQKILNLRRWFNPGLTCTGVSANPVGHHHPADPETDLGGG